MKIAYILKGYPRLSESFIANEVRLLGQMGMDLQLFSIKKGDAMASSDDLPPAHYLPAVSSLSGTGLLAWLKQNLPTYREDQRFWLRHNPARYLSALGFALKSAMKYRNQGGGLIKKTFIKEFLFATHIAREIIQRGGVEHLHAHFCHDATMVAWMVSRLTGIPFSFTAHAKDIYQEGMNPKDLLQRKLSAASFAVTCTQTNVTFLKDRCTQPDKVHGIYHGLNTGMFKPRDVCAAIRPVARLVAVGRMVEKKGFIYLIEACGLLRDRGIPFALDIIGEQGDQTTLLEFAIRKHALTDHIRLLSPMPQANLVGIYRESDVFVLPCVVVADGDRDGIPNVMAEAMACGLPVVVTDVSGIPEIVNNGRNGVIVPPRDSAALADAIADLIAHPEKGVSLGSAARASIETVFDASRTHESLKSLFDRFAGRAAHAG
ncbi:MAG: glycosyltransferase [Gammaproteobacteria bacterium]|nr:glycosyltransferase [Gammaproteobacteria bacterium]